MLAFLMRCVAVGVQFIYALIAGISQKFYVRRNGQATAFEQREIMRFASAGRHAQNPLFVVVNHDLSFLGMALFLAGVAVALFFWGRSTRCSLASTTITVRSNEPSCNAFLPGR